MPVTLLTPSTMMVSTEWLRLLRSFILVSATALFLAPVAITSSTSSVVCTGTCSSDQAPANTYVWSSTGATLLLAPFA